MSSGHKHGDILLPIPDGLYEETQRLVFNAQIVRGMTIPYLANRSRDGQRVYLDVDVPDVLPKTGIKPDDTLPWHELSEWVMQNRGGGYPDPSHYIATAVEKRRVEELGGDWDEYEDEFAGYIREVDSEEMTNIPLDIDDRPYVDDNDKTVLDELRMGKLMAAIHRLKNIRIDEVSLVDRGANQHADIKLFKRGITPATPVADKVLADLEPFIRSFSEAELTKAFSSIEDNTMTEAEIKKMVDDAVAAATAAKDKELAVAKAALAVATMSVVHKGYMAEAGLSGEKADAFVALSDADRDAFVKANPVEIRLPESVKKALADAEKDRERLRKLEEKDEVATFAKKAIEIGLPEAHGEVLRKVAKSEGYAEVEKLIKGILAQSDTSALFKEFGGAGTGTVGATAYEQFQGLAVKLREAQPMLTEAQAFEKVFTDPKNAELKKRHDEENIRKLMRA